jgi:hypothetical protein
LDFFQFTYSFQLRYGPGVYSAFNRNEHQEYYWEAHPANKADNLSAICELIV